MAQGVARASEAVKESRNEQRHLAQSRKGAEAEKKVKDLLASNLCVSASLREIPYSFTPSPAGVWGLYISDAPKTKPLNTIVPTTSAVRRPVQSTTSRRRNYPDADSGPE